MLAPIREMIRRIAVSVLQCRFRLVLLAQWVVCLLGAILTVVCVGGLLVIQEETVRHVLGLFLLFSRSLMRHFLWRCNMMRSGVRMIEPPGLLPGHCFRYLRPRGPHRHDAHSVFLSALVVPRMTVQGLIRQGSMVNVMMRHGMNKSMPAHPQLRICATAAV
jgi:hypothetical protein